MSKIPTGATVTSVLAIIFLGACGGSNNAPLVSIPAPPAPITASGKIYDGPVFGGTLRVFSAAEANAGTSSLVQLVRDEADGENFTIEFPADQAGQALFFALDADGAEDQVFGDQPFSLEAVAIAGDPGSQLTINLTPHTTTASIEVRNALDPDGDGVVIDAQAIATALETALANSRAAFGISALGDDLFPGGEDPHTTVDPDILETASTELGRSVRLAASFSGQSMDEVIYLFAADAADGALNGAAPASFGLSAEQAGNLVGVTDAYKLGRDRVTDIEAASCTGTSDALRRACEFEVLDEFFVGTAVCAHSESEGEADLCVEAYAVERDDALDSCSEVTASRLELCAATNDAIHDPGFGMAFSTSFVDPMTIGVSTMPNPYFPMIQGSVWTYEGTFEEDAELITEVVQISVTDRTKLIDGIRCLVVRDVVSIDGELVEDTDDWFAQDTDGNIWYCGEEAKDYEVFDGDSPAIPELVAIDGSFKAGRDGDEAGVLLPFTPVIGDIHRQEVSFTNAEDVIEILAIDGTESVPAAMCAGTCLVTRDFTPLDPGAEENKYYASGIGKILEIDLESGDRVELISYTIP